MGATSILKDFIDVKSIPEHAAGYGHVTAL